MSVWWTLANSVDLTDLIQIQLQMILDAIEQVGGIYVVTADHGNAEDMVKRNKKGEPLLDKNGNIQILTSHTLQPVRSRDSQFSNQVLKDTDLKHQFMQLV